MDFIKILTTMVFLHIIDDYFLQGILSSLKQKKFWDEKAPEKLYRHDYKMALLMHSMSWSFMINLPFLLLVDNSWIYLISFIINTIIHCYVDDLKANRLKINLIIDQSIHLFQIITTAIIMCCYII